eukprot:SAG31_NODE_26374_length_443_cov_1.148256_1_plen_23_part_01
MPDKNLLIDFIVQITMKSSYYNF